MSSLAVSTTESEAAAARLGRAMAAREGGPSPDILAAVDRTLARFVAQPQPLMDRHERGELLWRAMVDEARRRDRAVGLANAPEEVP